MLPASLLWRLFERIWAEVAQGGVASLPVIELDVLESVPSEPPGAFEWRRGRPEGVDEAGCHQGALFERTSLGANYIAAEFTIVQ